MKPNLITRELLKLDRRSEGGALRVLSEVEALVRAEIDNFDLSNLTMATFRLGRYTRSDDELERARRILALMRDRLIWVLDSSPLPRGRDVSDVYFGYSSLFVTDAEVLAAVSAATVRILDDPLGRAEFSTSDLSGVFRAAPKFGVSQGLLLERVAAELLVRLSDLEGLRQDPLTPSYVLNIVGGSHRAAVRAETLASLLERLAPVATLVLPRLSSLQLTRVLEAYARHPDQAATLAEDIAWEAAYRISYFEPDTLVSLAGAFDTLRFHHSVLFGAIAWSAARSRPALSKHQRRALGVALRWAGHPEEAAFMIS